MKYFFTALWAIVCLVVLFFGYRHWNDKTAVHADVAEKTTVAAVKEETVDISALAQKTKNWPEQAQTQFQQAVAKKKPFKILFIGSTALDGWVETAKQEVTAAYGKDIIKLASHTYDVTTAEFIEKNDELEISAEKAGLVFFEPLLLNDNGALVSIEKTMANITQIIEDVKKTNPETTFIHQPSYPLYNTKNYPLQVAVLKAYAQKNKLTYLDHWQAWPDTNDLKLKDYLLDDNSGANDLGNEVWGQFIVDYLVNKGNN
jgi:hypothetical protein